MRADLHIRHRCYKRKPIINELTQVKAVNSNALLGNVAQLVALMSRALGAVIYTFLASRPWASTR